MRKQSKFILIFIDGIGLGGNCEANPFGFVSMPTLNNIIGAPILDNIYVEKPNILCKGIDATLGVQGIPQSATGQTALFTGLNASKELGYHLPAFPNKNLINLIHKHSLFKKVSDIGLTVSFANAYRPEYFNTGKAKLEYSVTTHCVLSAELPFLLIDDLVRQKAVYWDITNRQLKDYSEKKVHEISAYQAGENLAYISRSNSLTVFESFESDIIGHRMCKDKATIFLNKLDMFLKGIVDKLPDDTSIILTSDHGNLEELNHGSHTRNQVPLIVVGKHSKKFLLAKSIMDIAPNIISILTKEVEDR